MLMVSLAWAATLLLVNYSTLHFSSLILNTSLEEFHPAVDENKSGDNNESLPLPPVVFYNFFMGASNESRVTAARIAVEQLAQVNSTLVEAEVRFVTIGHDEAASTVTRICTRMGSLNCQHIAHFPNGTEYRTLAVMRDFCQTALDGQRVVYLHNKGSFHRSPANENWRFMLTAAALSDHCLTAVPSQCNVCSLHFHTIWTTMATGNMFAADCNYVRSLIDPLELHAKLESAAGHAWRLKWEGRLDMELMGMLLLFGFFGLGRYADEFWIGSHPDVQPCHLDACGDLFKCYLQKRGSEESLRLTVGPQAGPPLAQESYFETIGDLRNDTQRSRREYYLLPGLLLKWLTITGKGPPPESWVWSYFPDGEFWKGQLEKHGVLAVDKALEMSESDGMQQLFSTDSPEVVPCQGHDAIFFDIKGDNASVRLTGQQLDLVNHSDTRWAVYLNNLSDITHNFCKNVDSPCQWINTKRGFRGDTLQALYEYCQASPNSRVAYIHNILPTVNTLGAERLLLHQTAAALSSQCRAVPQCNACGLVFTTTERPSFKGNMWTADCSYVSSLLPPQKFVARMQDVAERILVEALTEVFSMGASPARPATLGLLGSSLVHWIGSHPSLVPCSLSPSQNLTIWMKGNHMPDYVPSIGPRGLKSKLRMKSAEGSPDMRLREFRFLPGQILKWSMLYGQVPPDDSWFWDWYPDGELWKHAVTEHGALSALHNITAEYAKKY